MVIAMSQPLLAPRTSSASAVSAHSAWLLVQAQLLRRALVAANGLSSVAAAGNWSALAAPRLCHSGSLTVTFLQRVQTRSCLRMLGCFS